MESAGEWLEKALVELCKRVETGLDLDRDVISGLVTYCDLAQPLDAREYLDSIIGQDAGKDVIEEYLRRRGHSDVGRSTSVVQSSKYQAYVKPATTADKGSAFSGTKKPSRATKEAAASTSRADPKKVAVPSYHTEAKKTAVYGYQETRVPTEANELSNKASQGSSRKKKAGKVIPLAEAAKGSIVFQQGKPCSCQARQHRLVSNCLSCGKIICEQEGEGPCSFCGALVLKEVSTYAGLEEGLAPLSDAEAAAEAYAKRLIEYDQNSAARTTVIDDQSDYYEIEGNSWLSKEEKELLRNKQEEIEEAERVKRNKVVVTFDLLGRKVLVNRDEVAELELENRILRPLDEREREANRIKPNPNLRIQPIFIDPGHSKRPSMDKKSIKSLPSGMCLEITGRVQRDSDELKHFMIDNQLETTSFGKPWQGPSVNMGISIQDDRECSLGYT